MKKDKILLVYKNDEGELSVESVWATKLADKYKIDNIPFFANNLAIGDIVSIENDEGDLYFDELIETSENSTIRIIFFDDEKKEEILKKILEFKCGWEGSHIKKLVSVNVPSNVNYLEFKSFLDSNKDIDYQEGCISNTHKLQITK